ncbi:hybrid signal transduction histidine kinase D-like [Cylas formicarius]|uniref:hybrid signal transduction histidine kinase D-like n=1 Tax=Cylas formicarius TaxID=197179 RepID=UPI00295856E0|nr:hybrid signal transduction histidine kinase D-like [Cylas formicarius]
MKSAVSVLVGCAVIGAVFETASAVKCLSQYVPHPTDCGKFYECSNDRLYPFTCSPGLYFSRTLDVCVWPLESGCVNRDPRSNGASIKTTCISQYIPHPADCRKFFECSNGELREFICPENLEFSSTLEVCIWASESGCISRKPHGSGNNNNNNGNNNSNGENNNNNNGNNNSNGNNNNNNGNNNSNGNNNNNNGNNNSNGNNNNNGQGNNGFQNNVTPF